MLLFANKSTKNLLTRYTMLGHPPKILYASDHTHFGEKLMNSPKVTVLLQLSCDVIACGGIDILVNQRT